MNIKFENELGIITYREGIINQIISDAIKPYEGKAKYMGDRKIRFSSDGLFIYTGISIRLGYSMKDIARGLIDYMADAAENSLEIPVEDIIVEILQTVTSKSTVERNVRFSLREEYAEEE